MSVSVLNTDAQIAATTLVNAESAQDISGLKTFDRDPNAPFAVSSGSAVVPNLDADKLDGQEGSYYLNVAANHVAAWTNFVPTWTGTGSNPAIGNGTLAGRYLQIGKLVMFEIEIVMGSTTTFGAGTYEFALPVTAENVRGAFACTLLDDGTSFYTATAVTTSTTKLRINVTSASQVRSDNPFLWAVNDYIKISGFYPAA